MKTTLFILALSVLLFFSNPSMEKHKAVVNQQCKELNPITGVLGGCALYSQMGLEYHTFFLCSITLATLTNSGSGAQPVTIGVLGMVFVVRNLNI